MACKRPKGGLAHVDMGQKGIKTWFLVDIIKGWPLIYFLIRFFRDLFNVHLCVRFGILVTYAFSSLLCRLIVSWWSLKYLYNYYAFAFLCSIKPERIKSRFVLQVCSLFFKTRCRQARRYTTDLLNISVAIPPVKSFTFLLWCKRYTSCIILPTATS